MFARQLNQIRIDLSITPRGPVLIRSGRESADPTRPAMELVRTTWGGGPSVYLPGSSLKGVLRSHAERLLLSENVAITPTFAGPSSELNQKTPGPVAYASSSPLGRTFGNLYVKGHVAVTDHLPGAREPEGSEERQHQIVLANTVEQRNGVAIDRLLGSAHGGALFDRELLVQGRFDGHILLRNAQLYQLALVLLVLRDLDEGWVHIGSGTTRGHGRIAAEVHQILFETPRGKAPGGKIVGVGALCENAADYALFDRDTVSSPLESQRQQRLLRDAITVPSKSVPALAESLIAGPWTAFLEQAEGLRWSA